MLRITLRQSRLGSTIGLVASVGLWLFVLAERVSVEGNRATLKLVASSEIQHGPASDLMPLRLELSVKYPKKLALNQDGELVVTIERVVLLETSQANQSKESTLTMRADLSNLGWRVEPSSESFGVSPSESEWTPLEKGEYLVFVLSPHTQGERRLRLASSIRNQIGTVLEARTDHEVIAIEVTDKVLFGFLSDATIRYLSVLASIIGLPSLVAVLITRWAERRKSRKEQLVRLS